jgi:rhodanese-related sulfurtransferase
MNVKRVSADEARALIEDEGYVYVDVRSIPEFDAGHPAGAFNVPLMHMGRIGMSPNPDFMAVMHACFPKDAKLVVGCKSGSRSFHAAAMLQAAGYQNVVDQRSGFDGGPDPRGGFEQGWRTRGLPVATQAAPGRSYEALKAKA